MGNALNTKESCEEKKEFDLNRDGEITEEEIINNIKIQEHRSKLSMLKDRSNMAWVSLLGMVLYPLLLVFCSAVGFQEAAQLLSDITGVYFGSIAVVVAAFMGSEAYLSANSKD